MKRHFCLVLLISLFLFSLSFISCSQDALMSTGRAMGKLGKLGFGVTGKQYINSATEKSESFLMIYNSASLEDDSDLLKMSDEGVSDMKNVVRDLAVEFKNASESSADDSGLREVLSKKIQTDESCSRNLSEIIGSSKFSVISDLLAGVESFNKIELPVPFTGSDFSLLARRLMNSPVASDIILKLYNPSSEESSLDLSKIKALAELPQMLADAVGDRDYQVLGDKIVSGFLYDALDAIVSIFERNKTIVNNGDVHGDVSCFEGVGERLVSEFDNDLDRILSDLNSICFIYNVKIDIGGIVSDLV